MIVLRNPPTAPPDQPLTLREWVRRARDLLANLPRIFRLIWDTSPPFTALLTLLTLLQGLLPLPTVWITKLIVDDVLLTLEVGGEPTQRLALLVALQIGIFLATQAVAEASNILRLLLGDLISHRVNVMVLEKANTLDLSYFEASHFYDKLQNAQQEVGVRPLFLLDTTINLARSLITLVGMIAFLVAFHPLLALGIAVTEAPHLWYQFRFARIRWEMMTFRAPQVRRMSYLSSLLTTDAYAKEVRLFGLGRYLLERYREIFRTFYRENRALVLSRSRWALAFGAASALGAGIANGYIVLLAIGRRITIGDLTLYLQAVMQTRGALQGILASVGLMYESNLFINNLFELLALEPRMAPEGKGQLLPRPLKEAIEFRNVTFTYPGGTRPVLENLSFTLGAGEAIALVGENGAGKTTIVKLLTRLYDPSDGVILLDGVDLREYELADLRRQIGVIFQDYARYQLRVRENIGFGQIEFLDDLERIISAAERSGAGAVVNRLPEGYDTTLGRSFQDGVELSGGEWQKIALARAFMRDAQLLVLDEPTSALDAAAEYEVYSRFHELTAGRTTLLISHRFSTVRMADHIVVLEGGRVIEEGTHDALIASGGEYARLFKMQAERYT